MTTPADDIHGRVDGVAGSGWLVKAAHLRAWARERFPWKNVVMFAVLYATMAVVARSTSGTPRGVPATFSPRDLAALVAFVSFFLVLRVLDEHKDFAADAMAHPGRTLQRGLVTLRDLRVVGATAAATTLAVTIALSLGDGTGPWRPPVLWWTATTLWTALMTREFFAPAWLRERIVWYALSHMIVMPLATGWMMSLAAPDATVTPATFAMMALTLSASLSVEIARKIRAPGDEHPLADSYTQSLGAPRAMALFVTATLGAVAAAYALAHLVAGARNLARPTETAVMAAVLLVGGGGGVAAIRFARRPTRARARTVEAVAGLSMLLLHVGIIALAFLATGGARR